MAALPKSRMTIGDYLSAAREQSVRGELLDGVAVAISQADAGRAD